MEFVIPLIVSVESTNPVTIDHALIALVTDPVEDVALHPLESGEQFFPGARVGRFPPPEEQLAEDLIEGPAEVLDAGDSTLFLFSYKAEAEDREHALELAEYAAQALADRHDLSILVSRRYRLDPATGERLLVLHPQAT